MTAPPRPPRRALALLLRLLGKGISGAVLCLLGAARHFRRLFGRAAARAPSVRPDPAIRRRAYRRMLARSLWRRAPWRRLGLAAGLLALAAVGVMALCLLACFGAARYLVWGG